MRPRKKLQDGRISIVRIFHSSNGFSLAICCVALYDATAVESAEAANCYKKCFFLYGIFRREIGRKIPAYIIILEYLTSFAVVSKSALL